MEPQFEPRVALEFFGHFVGLLTPHSVYAPFISAPQKQLLAMAAGGVFGAVCFVGREGKLCAGFDLSVMTQGADATRGLGAEVLEVAEFRLGFAHLRVPELV